MRGPLSTMKKSPASGPPIKGGPNVPEHAHGEMPRWTFLTNHAHVLAVLHDNPELVLRHVATTVGITERAVQRIIHDLEEAGYIAREKVGRRNRYQVLLDVPLRHPIEAHRTIGDLLRLINVSG